MKIKFNYKPWLTALCLAGAMLMPSAYAGVNNIGLFELDGNPQDDTTTPIPGDDWDTPPAKGVNNAVYFTGIIPDPYPQSIFDGGKKDIQDISSWSYKDGAVPDKDNLTNAYAAAYMGDHDSNPNTPSHLMLYFGADRFANVGDAFMGFWFFQEEVKAADGGKFTGKHTPGDTLVLVDYPQGANEVPYIAVVQWDTTCTKAASNDPSPTECAAANLRLIRESNGATPALCDSTDQDACAITNLGEIDSPWAYEPKDGTVNKFPYESFFEGGIDLTELVGNKCFSSFMAETRSSSSFTASLKDFVLGSFENCSIKIVKTCKDSVLTSDQLAIENTFEGYVENTGIGTLYDVTVMDDKGTPNNGDDDFSVALVKTTITAGEKVSFNAPVVLTSTDNPMTNKVYVTAAATSGGTATVKADTSATCLPLALSPVISVSKTCSTAVVSDEGTPAKLNIKVEYSGKVCNSSSTSGGTDGPINMKLVSVTDDYLNTPADPSDDDIPVIAGTNTELKGQTLDAGKCLDFTGSYYPASSSSTDPAIISFSDTVTASGTAVLGGKTTSSTKTANCELCL